MIDTLALFILGALFCVSFATNIACYFAVRWWVRNMRKDPAAAINQLFAKADGQALAGHVFAWDDAGKLTITHPSSCALDDEPEPS